MFVATIIEQRSPACTNCKHTLLIRLALSAGTVLPTRLCYLAMGVCFSARIYEGIE